MGYIYLITNLINSKKYVGKTTTTIDERWKEHCIDSLKERCNKRPLYDAINKYGIENFKIEEGKSSNLNSAKSAIQMCAKGKRKSACGYKWLLKKLPK